MLSQNHLGGLGMGGQGQGQIGAFVSMSELDPELQSKIRGYDEDINDMKNEVQSIRGIVNSIKGLNKDKIDSDFKKIREEIKASCREILNYC